MKISELGEREAIKRIVTHFPESTKWGIGDDCATIKLGKQLILVTTDMISEKFHIPLGATGWQVGWFITAVNLSDIAAKAGQPVGMTLALGVPRSYDIQFLEDVARGANSCAKMYNMAIIGGDTKETESLMFTGTAVGVVDQDVFMPRKGAMKGDIVCVTGSLGSAGAGLHVLDKKKGDKKKAIRKILEIFPRVTEGLALGTVGGVTSSMDISDGVASSLYQLQMINDVGFRICDEKIPVAGYAKNISGGNREMERNWSLYTGGDYELLCTIKKGQISAAQDYVAAVGGILTPIGEVTPGDKIMLEIKGEKHVLMNKGFEHFK
jgi:thiamine-monophosphate kinase